MNMASVAMPRAVLSKIVAAASAVQVLFLSANMEAAKRSAGPGDDDLLGGTAGNLADHGSRPSPQILSCRNAAKKIRYVFFFLCDSGRDE
ncbi:MAG TPA: hypothetical protein VNS33_12760 [Bradyrhizobium sp.]|nr:hypothetical protein [Bradyrhizobium sp.]